MFNVKKVFNLFIFLFLFLNLPVSGTVLSNYGFDDFEQINDYFLNAETNSIYETERFKTLLSNILDDFLNICTCDLLEQDNWPSEYVPEILNSYSYDFDFFKNRFLILNWQLEDKLSNKYNFCFSTKNKVDEPCNVTVIGDMHGNYLDFSRIIADLIDNENEILTNDLRLRPGNRIVVLGDFVDRGPQGLELSLFLFLLKILNPETVTILKGNHECYSMTSVYGFRDELVDKIGRDLLPSVYGRLICLFSFLPEVYCLKICGKKFQFSHGGWSDSFDFTEFIDEEHPMFKMTFNGDPSLELSPFQWNDISPYISSLENVRGRGSLYPVRDIIDLMGNDIDAIFKGHDHYMPKNIQFKRKNLMQFQLIAETSGFCEILKRRIFLIISSSIYNGEWGIIRYKPSYAFLRVDDQSYTCHGVDCS